MTTRTFYVNVTYTLTQVQRSLEFVHKLNMLETDHQVFGPLLEAARSNIVKFQGWGAEDITALNVSWEEVA
jgi:hypothetical protein